MTAQEMRRGQRSKRSIAVWQKNCICAGKGLWNDMGLIRDSWEEDQNNQHMEEQEDLRRKIIENYKVMLECYDEADKTIQRINEAHRGKTLYFASHTINFRRYLRQLHDEPEKALEAYNKALKKRGKNPETWEEAVAYGTNALGNIKISEENWRKVVSKTFKDYLTEAEEELRANKKELSDCWQEEERNILRELMRRMQERKATLLKIISEIEIEAAGRKGEEAVEYVIKWLKADGYKSIVKDCLSKYGNVCILLKNTDYIDEVQEFDHIVVGENGVFIIETKNYAGVISISAEGDWIQEKDGTRKGIKNPVQQCNRHYGVMKSIVGDVPVTTVICIANDGVIIEGRKNCKMPIIKVELLQDFIKGVKVERKLTESEIKDITKRIQSKKKSEPLKLKEDKPS